METVQCFSNWSDIWIPLEEKKIIWDIQNTFKNLQENLAPRQP